MVVARRTPFFFTVFLAGFFATFFTVAFGFAGDFAFVADFAAATGRACCFFLAGLDLAADFLAAAGFRTFFLTVLGAEVAFEAFPAARFVVLFEVFFFAISQTLK
ncbi:MAG: hypothetical protein R3C19_01970 [Planctomycetaceae bacterium]